MPFELPVEFRQSYFSSDPIPARIYKAIEGR